MIHIHDISFYLLRSLVLVSLKYLAVFSVCLHSDVLVTHSCPNLFDPLDCSPSGSFCPWISPGKCCHSLLQRIFPTQKSNPSLLHCRKILYHLSHKESPKWKWSRSVVSDSCNPMDCNLPGSSLQGIFQAILECVAVSFSRGSSQPRDQNPVFCTAGREAHVYHIYQLNRGILWFWFLITHIYRNWVETTCFLQLCRNSFILTTFCRYSRFSTQVIMSSMNKNRFFLALKRNFWR